MEMILISGEVSCERYAVAIHRFLVSAPKAFGVDFGKRRLVGLGHSLGANSLWVSLHHREMRWLTSCSQVTSAEAEACFPVSVAHYRGADGEPGRCPSLGEIEGSTC